MGLPPYTVQLRNPHGQRVAQRLFFQLLTTGESFAMRRLSVQETAEFPFAAPPMQRGDFQPWIAVDVSSTRAPAIAIAWLAIEASGEGIMADGALGPLIEALGRERRARAAMAGRHVGGHPNVKSSVV
jgi:hypothetical protein